MNTQETLKSQATQAALDGGKQINQAMNDGAARVQSVRERISPVIDAAREKVGELSQQVKARALDAAKATDNYVRANPWYVLGAAVAVGLAVGAYASRRRRA
jgi:ElaB/YqjD/DUF883 family membrane-anchored ribosome-binding protein